MKYVNDFKIHQHGFMIQIHAEMLNRDLLLEITGGDVPHLGSVVMYDTQTQAVTVQNFLSHHGRKHKDGMLAEKLINQIKAFLPGNCIITSGVHVDQISREQIAASFEMVNKLGKEIITWLQQTNFKFKKPQYYQDSQKIDRRKNETASIN